RHVFAAEHTELEHLLRRQLRAKLRSQISTDRLGPIVAVTGLHPIVDHYALPHESPLSALQSGPLLKCHRPAARPRRGPPMALPVPPHAPRTPPPGRRGEP